MKSIRSFLTLVLVSSICLAVLITTFISHQRITHETEELYDAELAQISRVLEAVLAIELEFTGRDIPEEIPDDRKLILPPDIYSEEDYDSSGHKYEKKLAFQVWSRKGVPLLGSKASGSVLSFSSNEGYGQEQIAAQEWRTFVLYSNKLSIWIKVGQLMEIRDEITQQITAVYNMIQLVMLPILVLLITLIVRRGLLPLKKINQEISLRNTSNLAPLNFNRIPKELTQVVESVNSLMLSLDTALKRQMRFTSNAAHELRTPLAAIKVHAQNMYPESVRLQKIQESIILGIDKLTHLFNQLITLSHAESSQHENMLEEVKLDFLVNNLITNGFRHEILEKQLSIEIAVYEPEKVKSKNDALEIMLRNLLDNAIKYIHVGGRIKIETRPVNDTVTLSVSDNGPGLTDSQKKYAFERFYRAANQETEGCGLGLSIVYQLCEQLNYQVSLTNSEIADTGITVSIEGIQRVTHQTT